MAKTIEQNFIDWHNHVFGFGYGSGEPHIIPLVARLFSLIGREVESERGYDYKVLEKELGPEQAWLLINAFCQADVIEYGTSPRFGWLTDEGLALKSFFESHDPSAIVDLCTEFDENYPPCDPTHCNCGPNGYDENAVCQNPFWPGHH